MQRYKTDEVGVYNVWFMYKQWFYFLTYYPLPAVPNGSLVALLQSNSIARGSISGVVEGSEGLYKTQILRSNLIKAIWGIQ